MKEKIILTLLLVTILTKCQTALIFEKNIYQLEKTKIDDDLRDFVEFLKLQMECGYEPAGVPPLAPYIAEFKDFDMKADEWSLKGNFSDLVITGLNEFDVVELNWNNVLQKVTFDFQFPSIVAKSSYKLESSMSVMGPPVRFHGDGDFNLELVKLRAYGSFKLRPTLAGGLAVWAFKVKLELDTSHSKTTGIAGNLLYTKLFNAWIEELIALTFSEENSEALSNNVEKIVVPPMNKALRRISIVDLVAIITGIAQDIIPTEPIC